LRRQFEDNEICFQEEVGNNDNAVVQRTEIYISLEEEQKEVKGI
jgi:hypothetical protein